MFTLRFSKIKPSSVHLAAGRRRFCSSGENKADGPLIKFWNWTTQSRPSWRENKTEAAVLFCVFGVTGSSSAAFCRPALKNVFGMEGSMVEGPWSYRIASILIISPIYACILVTLGTLAGRHVYFANMARKIVSRFMPSKVSSKLGCPKNPKK